MTHLDTIPAKALRPILASLQSQSVHGRVPSDRANAIPFLTISRQAGAGATTLANALVSRLNTIQQAEDAPWSSWDRELVERVAADHGISRSLIDATIEGPRSWLNDLFEGFSMATDATRSHELSIYRRVASTIRALAKAGRVIIVGRGGAFITRDLPGGVHIRLVAPLRLRIETMCQTHGYSLAQATDYVRNTDAARERFCRQHFPGAMFSAEEFDITFNTSNLTMDSIVDCLLPMLTKSAHSLSPANFIAGVGRSDYD